MPKEKSISQPTEDEWVRMREDEELQRELAIRSMPETEGEKSTALEPLADSPALNRLLLRNARKTHQEIAAATGLPVEEVAERLSMLLDNKSWRDDLMEEKLLLNEIGMMVEDVRDRMSRPFMDDEAWASMARVQLQAIRTMLEQLAARRKDVDGKLSVVTKAQAKLMGEAIRLAQERAVVNIVRKFPHLEEEIIYAEFEEELPKAIEFLEANSHG